MKSGPGAIDGICKDLGFAPDIMKIDVEGCELLALQGSANVLMKRPTLFLEVHPELLLCLGYSQRAIFDLLSALGYVTRDVLIKEPMTRRDFARRHHTFFTLNSD